MMDASKLDVMPWLLITLYFPALLTSSVAIYFVLLKKAARFEGFAQPLTVK